MPVMGGQATGVLASLLLAMPLPLDVGAPVPASPAETSLRLSATPRVSLRLQPELRRLKGEATWQLTGECPRSLVGILHPRLVVEAVSLNGRTLSFERSGERLVVDVGSRPALAAGTLVLRYAGRPLASQQGALTQDVDPRVVVLREGGQWLPQWQTLPRSGVQLSVELPDGWRVQAITPRAEVRREGRSWAWQLPAGQLPAWLAGPHREGRLDGVSTWSLAPLPENASRLSPWLAGRLGEAVQPALATWIELPGGFAPMAGAGVLASRRPPGGGESLLLSLHLSAARPQAALMAERLWLVEGLACYLTRLAQAAGAPARVRREAEAAYGRFVQERPTQDRPIAQAWSAAEPAWTALIRDKGALSWAICHEAAGDEAFWGLLRAWRTELGRGGGTWEEFQAVSALPVQPWRRWFELPGLPGVRFENVSLRGADGAWQVSGELAQPRGGTGYDTDLVLVAQDGVQRVSFKTFSERTPFHFSSPSRPLRLVFDASGRAPVARREVVRITEALAAPGALIVFGTQGDAATATASQEVAQALRERLRQLDGVTRDLLPDSALAELPSRPLILVGTPAVNAVAHRLADQFPVRFVRPAGSQAPAIWWQGRAWTARDAGVVQAIANPQAPRETVLLLAGLSPAALRASLNHLEQANTFCLYDRRGTLEMGTALCPFPDLEYPLY
ncbi:MAG: hypothetical protein VKP62_05480 [Candidatus Sericytochromatia bacterium]|nr:hypothetical protein [Candidatus Sericytochromatia bacterium]